MAKHKWTNKITKYRQMATCKKCGMIKFSAKIRYWPLGYGLIDSNGREHNEYLPCIK